MKEEIEGVFLWNEKRKAERKCTAGLLRVRTAYPATNNVACQSRYVSVKISNNIHTYVQTIPRSFRAALVSTNPAPILQVETEVTPEKRNSILSL
jgi:hypothetical protein